MILCGFAVIVGVLTTQRIHDGFHDEVAASADKLARGGAAASWSATTPATPHVRPVRGSLDLDDFAASQNAAIRVITLDDMVAFNTANAPDFGRRTTAAPPTSTAGAWRRAASQVDGWPDPWFLQYARQVSEVQDTANRVKVFLAFGVLGGALLALLAGLATARRAMEPIAELTAAARRVERSRDPSVRIPHPEAEDEVAELARTLDAMLAALDESRAETEGALARQREFVADASHELRTPLTSVLANLELLEEELTGEQREAAASALRSSRRMRRLVADLLLLARADAGRQAPHRPVDLSQVVTDAASELEPVAGDHEISISAPLGRRGRGRARRAAPPRPEPDGERAPPHRSGHRGGGHASSAATARWCSRSRTTGRESRSNCARRCSSASTAERAIRAGRRASACRSCARWRSRIAAACKLEEPLDGRGARFVVRIPTA